MNVGQTIEVPLILARSATQLSAVTVRGVASAVDATRSEASTALDADAVSNLPNNGRNFLSLTTLTPNVAVTQGPDGDVLVALGREPWEIARMGEAVAKTLELKALPHDRAVWIDLLVANPILIERPIVVTSDGRAVLGRPPEAVRALF